MEGEDSALDLTTSGPYTAVVVLNSNYIPELINMYLRLMFRHMSVPCDTSVLRGFIIFCCESVGNCQTLSKDRCSQLVYNIIFLPFFFSLRSIALVSFLFLSRTKVRPSRVFFFYIVFMFINRQL